jgi:hypothetical protein
MYWLSTGTKWWKLDVSDRCWIWWLQPCWILQDGAKSWWVVCNLRKELYSIKLKSRFSTTTCIFKTSDELLHLTAIEYLTATNFRLDLESIQQGDYVDILQTNLSMWQMIVNKNDVVKVGWVSLVGVILFESDDMLSFWSFRERVTVMSPRNRPATS